jgi:hypothetical protein
MMLYVQVLAVKKSCADRCWTRSLMLFFALVYMPASGFYNRDLSRQRPVKFANRAEPTGLSG